MDFSGMSQPGGGGLPSGVRGDMLRHNGSAYASLAMLTAYDWFKNAFVPARALANFGAETINSSTARVFGLIQSSTTVGSHARSEDGDGYFTKYTSGSTIGNTALQQYTNAFQRRFDARAIVKFALESVADIRMWICATDQSNATVFGNDDPGGELCGLRFSTNVPDTNFLFAVNDGGTIVTEDTGRAADTAVYYYIYEVDNSVPQIRMLLLDSSFTELADHTFTADLPAETQDMKHMQGLATLAASAKVFRHYGIFYQNQWKGP